MSKVKFRINTDEGLLDCESVTFQLPDADFYIYVEGDCIAIKKTGSSADELVLIPVVGNKVKVK